VIIVLLFVIYVKI